MLEPAEQFVLTDQRNRPRKRLESCHFKNPFQDAASIEKLVSMIVERRVECKRGVIAVRIFAKSGIDYADVHVSNVITIVHDEFAKALQIGGRDPKDTARAKNAEDLRDHGLTGSIGEMLDQVLTEDRVHGLVGEWQWLGGIDRHNVGVERGYVRVEPAGEYDGTGTEVQSWSRLALQVRLNATVRVFVGFRSEAPALDLIHLIPTLSAAMLPLRVRTSWHGVTTHFHEVTLFPLNDFLTRVSILGGSMT